MSGRTRLLCSLGLFALAACGGDGGGPEPSSGPPLTPALSDLLRTPLHQKQPADPIRFTLDWPSSALQVEEISWKEMPDKPSVCVEFGYGLHLEEDVDLWILKRRDLHIDAVNGTPFFILPENVRSSMLGGLQYPGLAVLADGTHGGLVDFEGYVASLPQTLSKLGVDRRMTNQIVATSRLPQFRGLVEQKSGDAWRCWVETWLELEIGPGEEKTFVEPMEVAPGIDSDVACCLRVHGYVEEPPGHVLLSAEITMGFQSGQLLDLLKGLAKPMDVPAPPEADLAGMSFTSATRVVLVTDPRTLVPHRATTERVIRMEGAGGEGGIRREAREWRFTIR